RMYKVSLNNSYTKRRITLHRSIQALTNSFTSSRPTSDEQLSRQLMESCNLIVQIMRTGTRNANSSCPRGRNLKRNHPVYSSTIKRCQYSIKATCLNESMRRLQKSKYVKRMI